MGRGSPSRATRRWDCRSRWWLRCEGCSQGEARGRGMRDHELLILPELRLRPRGLGRDQRVDVLRPKPRSAHKAPAPHFPAPPAHAAPCAISSSACFQGEAIPGVLFPGRGRAVSLSFHLFIPRSVCPLRAGGCRQWLQGRAPAAPCGATRQPPPAARASAGTGAAPGSAPPPGFRSRS